MTTKQKSLSGGQAASTPKTAPALKTASTLKTQRAERDRKQASPPPRKALAVKVLSSRKLAQIPWLVHGFSTRQGGVSREYGGQQLNLACTAEDTPECVALNRARLLRKLKAQDASGNPWPLVVLNQLHSAVIHRVYGARGPEWASLRQSGFPVLPSVGAQSGTGQRTALRPQALWARGVLL